MAILNTFGGAGGGVRIPLESPTTFTASPQDGKVVLTWTDPVDKVASPGGEMVAPWDYTIVVRKIGSYPQTPKDGVEVTRETTRNQYQTTGYADTLSIENDITYYYALFAVSTFGVWSEPATATAKPTGAHPQFYKSQFISISGGNGVSAREGSALASTTNHFIFAGGQNGSEYEDSSFYNVYSVYFDKNLTKGLLDNSNGKLRNAYLTPGSFNGHAVFVGGTRLQEDNDATEMIAYTPTLTKQSPWIDALLSDWLREPYAIGIASANDHIFYAGGQTENNDTGNSGVWIPEYPHGIIYLLTVYILLERMSETMLYSSVGLLAGWEGQIFRSRYRIPPLQ